MSICIQRIRLRICTSLRHTNFKRKNRVVTAASEVIFSTDSFLTQPGSFQENFFDIYRYLSTAIFLMFVIGSATMLHHYASKMGRLKFWILLLLPLVYYASTLIDIVEIYVPQSDQEIFNYYLYASLIGVAGGGLLGFAFWTISNALKPNKAVMNYLRLCACGFILNVTASVASISAAPYPPFGAVSISVLTLSSYMIILGLYSTAVSISQDIRLRQFIKNMTKKISGSLAILAKLRLEKEIQTKASDLENSVKEQRFELEKESGIRSSLQQQDIQQYLLEVLQEVDKHK